MEFMGRHRRKKMRRGRGDVSLVSQAMKQTHEIKRKAHPEAVPPRMRQIDRIDIVSTADKATQIVDEVALLIKEVEGFAIPFPLYASFKAPEALKGFIEELIAFRRAVWADAEPINPDAGIEEASDG